MTSVPARRDREIEFPKDVEEKEEESHVLFLMLTVLLAAAVGAVWWRWRPKPTPPLPGPITDRELGEVVAAAYEQDWTTRFGVPAGELRTALRGAAPGALKHRIDQEVGIVDLRFDGSGRRGEVNATVIVSYHGAAERSTARVTLPWDDVPTAVRADLIRNAHAPVFRKWRALA